MRWSLLPPALLSCLSHLPPLDYLLQVLEGRPFDTLSAFNPTDDGSPLFLNVTVARDEAVELVSWCTLRVPLTLVHA